MVGAQFPSIVTQPPGAGWAWTDEGRGKWGYVSSSPGSVLRLHLDSDLPGWPGSQVMLRLAYLASYEGHGRALVHCEAGW